MISLEIFGKPVPWSSPRFSRGRAYSRHSLDASQVQWQIKTQYRDPPLRERVQLDFTFFLPIPQRTSGIRKRQMLAHVIAPETRPDTTNLQKFYEDCLKGIVLADDCLATDVSSRKRFSEKPGVLIRVIPWGLITSLAPEFCPGYSFSSAPIRRSDIEDC